MTITYGPASEANIGELHPELQRLLRACALELPSYFDISVTCGWRGEADQNEAFRTGASKLRWPDSAHNKKPARAYDYACYGRDQAGKPVQVYDIEDILMRQGAMRLVAHRIGVRLRPLIDWDKPHVELAKDVP